MPPTSTNAQTLAEANSPSVSNPHSLRAEGGTELKKQQQINQQRLARLTGFVLAEWRRTGSLNPLEIFSTIAINDAHPPRNFPDGSPTAAFAPHAAPAPPALPAPPGPYARPTLPAGPFTGPPAGPFAGPPTPITLPIRPARPALPAAAPAASANAAAGANSYRPCVPPAGTTSTLWYYGTQTVEADGRKYWNCFFCK
ncbi:hypothetical protein K440DRAFT_682580 [Wilcoxina mikolae CBS 423.85]|nr:hypothetical protein K440DRAFT_682580 [Wilcoxina mikolae CBS 423.85]